MGVGASVEGVHVRVYVEHRPTMRRRLGDNCVHSLLLLLLLLFVVWHEDGARDHAAHRVANEENTSGPTLERPHAAKQAQYVLDTEAHVACLHVEERSVEGAQLLVEADGEVEKGD